MVYEDTTLDYCKTMKQQSKTLLIVVLPIAMVAVYIGSGYDIPSIDPAAWLNGIDLIIYSVAQFLFLIAFISLCITTGIYFSLKWVIRHELEILEKRP